MSRVGKAPINLPAKVEVSVSKGNLVTIKGPKGSLSQQLDPDITVEWKTACCLSSAPPNRSATAPCTASIAR